MSNTLNPISWVFVKGKNFPGIDTKNKDTKASKRVLVWVIDSHDGSDIGPSFGQYFHDSNHWAIEGYHGLNVLAFAYIDKPTEASESDTIKVTFMKGKDDHPIAKHNGMVCLINTRYNGNQIRVGETWEVEIHKKMERYYIINPKMIIKSDDYKGNFTHKYQI